MAGAKIVFGFMAAATLAACSGEQSSPVVAAPGEMTTPVAPEQPAAAPATAGPIDGVWRCKMVGDIPLGTLTFSGGAYTFQTTNTAWEPNPNKSDGAGTVTFNETFALPVDGPLKSEFAVTGAFGDGSFINWNNNLGMLFGCRRP